MIRIWNLETDEVRTLNAGDDRTVWGLAFTPDGRRLLAAGDGGARDWDLAASTFVGLRGNPIERIAVSADGLGVLTGGGWRTEAGAVLHDLRTGSSKPLPTHGNSVTTVAFGLGGELVVTGDARGNVRVGPATGEEPHQLLGHEGVINDVAVDPKGRWIASAGQDNTIRLWPIPSGRPFHTLPHDEFLARLGQLTNLCAVKDAGAPSGYRIDAGPFPGWQTVPTW